jgi:nuclear pore complex protein Nup160
MEQLAQFVNKSFEFNLTNNRVNNLFNSMTSARIQKLTEATNSILVSSSNRLGRSSVDNCADNDNEESMDIDITDISVAEDSSYEDDTVVSKPLSLVVDSKTGLIAVMQKSHIQLIARPDVHTDFLVVHPRLTAFPDEVIQEMQPILLPGLKHMLQMIHAVSQLLNDEACHLFESELRKGHRACDAAAVVLDTCLLTTEQPGDRVHATLKSLISSIHSYSQSFDDVMEFIVKCLDLSMENVELGGGENRSSMEILKHLFNSESGRAALVDGLKSFSKKRFEFSRNLLLLISVMVQVRDKTSLTTDKIEKTRSLVLKTIEEQVHNYFVLLWSCQATMDDTRKPNVSGEVDEAHLNVLELAEYIKVCRIQDRKPSQCTSLLMKFLEHRGRQFVLMTVSEKYASTGHPARFGWDTVFPDCVVALAQLLWPSSTSFLLPEFLIGCKQYSLLAAYVSIMDCWVQWNSFSRTFLMGFVSLVNGDAVRAVQHFDNAIFGVTTEPFLRNFAHVTTAMDTTMGEEVFLPSEAVFNYYTKVIQLFKNQSEPEAILSLAETAIKRLDPKNDPDYTEHMSCLFTTIFLYRLGLDQYESAYDVMVMNPDVQRRRDCLRQFIVRLYENNCASKLLSFTFSDFSDEFVNIIESKARSCDLSSISGCGYYELLYSYYAKIGNFRRAATIMYEYARRLSQEVPGMDSLTKQVNCYLITLTSLSLVNQKYAWIVKPSLKQTHAGDIATDNLLKRSITQEPKEKHVKREIDVVDVNDIRKEYEMTRSRLKLLTKSPKLNEIASCILTPSEVLTLLISNGLFDASFQLAKVMELPMTSIFEGLVSRYVRFVQLPLFDMRTEDSLSEFYECFTENDSVAQSFLGTTELPAISKLWHLISLYLQKYEDKNQSSLHRCVAERLLMSGVGLPAALIHSYQVCYVINAPSYSHINHCVCRNEIARS